MGAWATTSRSARPPLERETSRVAQIECLQSGFRSTISAQPISTDMRVGRPNARRTHLPLIGQVRRRPSVPMTRWRRSASPRERPNLPPIGRHEAQLLHDPPVSQNRVDVRRASDDRVVSPSTIRRQRSNAPPERLRSSLCRPGGPDDEGQIGARRTSGSGAATHLANQVIAGKTVLDPKCLEPIAIHRIG